MKLTLSLQGMAAVRVSADDVVPERGLLQRDLVQFIGNMYNFAVIPNIPPNISPQAFPILGFQQGRFVNEDGVFPIQQLVIFQNGDAVTAANTDIAEIILNDYINRLDEEFGYRYRDKYQKRYYVSNIIVELEHGIGEQIPVLCRIGELLTKEIPRENMPFDTKGLVFGYGDPIAAANLSSMELFEKADFTIERRAGEPYERNRYFSSAPVRTSDHVRILELIEEVIRELGATQ
jgi:hypothetical protein